MSGTSKIRANLQVKPSHPGFMTKTESDGQHLLTIFPQEVWSLVLGNVKVTNYHRISNTSPLFHNLLLDKRIQIMFPAVVQIITERFHEWVAAWEPNNGDGSEADDAKYYGQKYLLRDLAPARLVSRQWRQGLDYALQHQSLSYMFAEEHKTLEIEQFFYSFAHLFKNLKDFEIDSTHLATGANPFTNRRIILRTYELTPGELLPYYAACLDMLRDFGTHVWYLQMEVIVKKFQDQLIFYRELRKILRLVPNLKVFRISMGRNVLSKPQIQTLWQSLRGDNGSFPTLKELTAAQTYGIPFPVFCELVRPNVATLKQARVELATYDNFRSFVRGNLALEKVGMDLSKIDKEWGKLFRDIDEHMGTTLKDLYVHLPSPLDFQFSYQLKLQHLKKFQMTVRRAVPLDFLLGVANHLEELGVRTRLSAEQREEVIRSEREVKFYQHLDKLHESNIWIKFPKLKEVILWPVREEEETRFICCTREQWEYHNRKFDENVSNVDGKLSVQGKV